MSETLVILRDPNIGDALLNLPALHALAAELAPDRLIYAAFANREVAEIAEWPINVRNILEIEPAFGLGDRGSTGPKPYADAEIIVLGIAAAIGYQFGPTVMHPTQAIMAWAGLDIPDEVPQPKINVADADVPVYDYLIAPFSKSPERSLTRAELGALVASLPAGSRIGVLGGAEDPQVFEHHVAFPEYGKTLTTVVNMMRKCKGAVITTDSACNRLAHAAGIKNHLLIANSSVTPLQWQRHPDATVLDIAGGFRTEALASGLSTAESWKVSAA